MAPVRQLAREFVGILAEERGANTDENHQVGESGE